MPGQNFETDKLMGETITTKYLTPTELLQSKLSPNKFSMLHINIASLSKHIDKLRSLLTILKHPFDVIGITEKRLHDGIPLVNLGIEGYKFKHTNHRNMCRGGHVY